MPNPLAWLFEGKEPNRIEFEQFKKWLKGKGYTEQAVNVTLARYRSSSLYNTWRAETTVTDTGVEAAVGAGAPPETGLIDPVDYVFWYKKILLEDPEVDKSDVPQMVADMQKRIETEGFNEFYEGYALARDYIDGIRGRDETWVGNWQGSGQSAIVDKYGNLVRLVGETPSDEMDAFEAAQIGLSKEQLVFQRKQAREELAFRREELTLQREAMGAESRRAELDSALRLAALGEEGWIEKYLTGYAKQMMSLEEQKQTAKAAGARAREKLAEAGGAIGKFPRRPIGLTVTAQTQQQKVESAGERVRGLTTAKQEVPTTPPTPKWLPQFAPWLTEGQPIEKGQVSTPSGQLWGQTSPSAQAGLRGFTKWAGGASYEDMLAQMRRMQPQAPRGAGQQRWLPARQR